MNLQSSGHTLAFRKSGLFGGLIHATLRHIAVGGPLPPGNAQQSRRINVNGVIARVRRCLLSIARAQQWTNARKGAEYVASLWLLRQVEAPRARPPTKPPPPMPPPP